MPSRRFSAGSARESQDGEEDEEQSEKCIGCLLRWLQAAELLPEDLPASGRRLPAHRLGELAFISAVVARVCPATHAAQVEALGQSTGGADVVAGCLAAVIRESYDITIDMEAVVRRAVKAGEHDMEPLGDIVALWRHILTFAVCCESKQRHVDSIMQMPADLQAGLMELIEANEQRLSAPPGAKGASGQAQAKGARVSLSSLRDRTSAVGLRTPRASLTNSPLPLGEHAADAAHDVLVKENEWLRERARLLQEQVEKDRQLRQRTTVVLDGEFETFEKSWNLEKLLGEREDRITELELQVRNGRSAVEENRQLREEMLLAQSREAEHAAVKARLERCSQRLEEAGDLKLEVQAHAEKYAEACRERDGLAQELAQLKSAGQQLDAWKAKVRDLELRQRETEAKAHAAESQAKAMEAEQQKLAGEKAIAEEKLQDCQLEVAALRESGPRGVEGGEVYEPFTPELQERMRSLESRNAVLEQQLTVEGSQRVAELIVEGETLKGLKDHWEQVAGEHSERLTATSTALEEALASVSRLEVEVREREERLAEMQRALDEERETRDALEEQLGSADERNAMVSEELQQRLLELHELSGRLFEAQAFLAEAQEELASEKSESALRMEQNQETTQTLQEFGVQLADITAEVSDLQAQLDASQQELQAEHDRCGTAQRELDVARAELSKLERRNEQLKDEMVELRRRQQEIQQSSERDRRARADAESRCSSCEQEKADLARQLQHYRCEQGLHQRNRADLAEREELSQQRQSDLMARMEELRLGLSDAAGHNKSLREQVDSSEFFCKQLKAALRHYSPEDLRRLEEEQESGAGIMAVTPESELAQVRVENRRLHAQLAEQRLRGAEEAKRSAQACAKLRHWEKCAEQGMLQAEKAPAEPEPSPEPAESTPSPRRSEAEEERPPGRLARQGSAQEASALAAARAAVAAPEAGPERGKAPGPRSSILKKPKSLSCDFNEKENRLGSSNILGGQADGASKVKSSLLRSKRPGLIGCVG